MTRQPAPESRPVGLTIAGSDAGGGAGIQADLKTMEANGVFGTTVITSVTAQNTQGVTSTHPVPIEEITAQYRAVTDDFAVRAAKTGMLGTAAVVETVTDLVGGLEAPLVVDPVMVAASGDRLLDESAEDAYGALLDEATLVTPNADEAGVLTGITPEDEKTARRAGHELVDRGADAALIKGGHVPGETVTDLLVTADREFSFVHPRIETEATHGSGCTISSAIVAGLATGQPLEDAVEAAVSFMERAVRYPLDVGHGPGSVNHLVGLRDQAARQPVQEAVESAVQTLVDAGVRDLVPEVGLNVVGATPYAEATGDTAAVEGRITKTLSGIKPNRGVRFGASSHVARFLLTAREFEPALQFAANLRFDDAMEQALDALDWPTVEIDRSKEPAPGLEGSTMQWAARRAFETAVSVPYVVYDRGDVGKEAITRLLAPDAATLTDRTITLHESR